MIVYYWCEDCQKASDRKCRKKGHDVEELIVDEDGDVVEIVNEDLA